MLLHYLGPGSKAGSLINVIVAVAATGFAIVDAVFFQRASLLLAIGPVLSVVFGIIAWRVWTRRRIDRWWA